MAKVNKKVLIIEDDGIVGSMYKMKLESDGFDAVLFMDGSDGLNAVEKEKPNIIILDVILPGMDGFSILRELKENAAMKDVPVVMLTNLSTKEDVEKGKRMGVVEYLIKSSLTPAQVSAKIKRYLK